MQSKIKTTRITVTAISRRSALKGAAGLASVAASSVTLGRLTGAWAQTPSAINPYAVAANTGSSSMSVPAVGATPSVR
jgi:hypothetical protein